MTFAKAIKVAHKMATTPLPWVPRQLLWHVANRQCPQVPYDLRYNLEANRMRWDAIREAVVSVVRVRGY